MGYGNNVYKKNGEIIIFYNNKEYTIKEASNFSGLPHETIKGRIKIGWDANDIMELSHNQKRKNDNIQHLDPLDLIGFQLKRTTVLEYLGRKRDKHSKWRYEYLCQCSCGNKFIAERNGLRFGITNSCGCIQKETLSKNRYIPIKNPNKPICNSDKRIYRIWKAMHRRCYNLNDWAYKYYGEKGIIICEEWHEFDKFEQWALNNGYSDELTIDRINSDGNYEPSNCRWTTMQVQNNNTSKNHYITLNGKTQSLADWCRELNIPYDRTKQRINMLGFSPEEALLNAKSCKTYEYGEGVFKQGREIMLTYNDITMSARDWQDKVGINRSKEIFSERARKGWSAKQIIETPPIKNYKKESTNEK